MPMPLLALASLAFIGCVSSAARQMEPEPAPECLAGEFSGTGTGESESEALAEAYSALARQISSSLNVTIERVVSQRVSNGKEDLRLGYESKTVMESFLPNAHDARIMRGKHKGNKTSVTACMAKADAAKGFLERQRLIADSLELVSGTALNVEHPMHKNEAWRRTQMLYSDFMRIQSLLEGWRLESPYSADEIYSRTREYYKNYCQGMKVFWQDAGNECSNAAFTAFSKKIKIEKSRCLGGLNLNFNCQERCKSSPYGIECFYEPSLSIESCGGESYSLLKAQKPMIGSDMYNEDKAMERLAENLPKAVFFDDWEKEIKKWVPQCAD